MQTVSTALPERDKVDFHTEFPQKLGNGTSPCWNLCFSSSNLLSSTPRVEMRDDCLGNPGTNLAVFRQAVKVLQHLQRCQAFHSAEEDHLAFKNVPLEQQADTRLLRQLLRFADTQVG